MKRHLPSLRSLEIFEAAARHLSFTRAAEELGLTQSAVSRQMAILEEFLGHRLFERVRKRVVLTQTGTTYAARVRSSLDGIEAATSDVTSAPGKQDILHISTLATLGVHWLMPRMTDFIRRHPEIGIQLITYRHRNFDRPQEEIDVVIHYGEPSWPEAIVEFLMGEAMIVVCSPDFVDRHDLRTVDDLKRVPLLQQSSRPDAWLDWLAAAGGSNVNALRGPRFEQYAMVIEGAISGLGAAVVPEFLLAEYLSQGRLVAPFDVRVNSRWAYYLVYPETKRSLPKVQAFRTWLLRVAPTILTPGWSID